jgi:ATP/ADP translocase
MPSRLWRLLPAVRTAERGRFLFFASLYGLLTLAQTVGLVGAEAFFLGRSGAEALPRTFVIASLTTVLASLAYAAVVGRARNDGLFVAMLLTTAALLGAGSLLSGAPAGPGGAL